jgi:predicted aldo/keto reductase-like oxidoreductase
MKYMPYGKTGLKVSRFGFGCMRFPRKTQGDEQVIDQDEVNRMIAYALEKGVNYFDTAYVYGGSEVSVGKAFKELNVKREDVIIVSKNPVFKAETREDLDKFLDEELERLQTDYIDVYFLHALNRSRWNHCQELDALKFLEEKKAEGKIRHAGFSFHGDVDTFEEIVDAWDWDIAQVQMNFLDTKHQAGMQGMKYAAAKGMAVVVMEPLRGGALVQNLPSSVEKAYGDFPFKRTPAEWAFRYLIDMDEPASILSGVSTMEQLKENIEIFSTSEPGCMTSEEKALIEEVTTYYKGNNNIGCTRCGYCMPCPHGVNIPEVFQLWNDCTMEDYVGHARFQYGNSILKQDKTGADRCTECGECEPKCPQNLHIIDGLKKAHIELTAV